MPEPVQPNSVRELQRLAEAPLRHPWLVVVPLVLVFLGAIGLSFVLPPRYRSSTLILVAPDPMPSNLVTQMTTEKVAERLKTLRQEVQSRTRLEMVARDLDPYGTLGKEPLIALIERMRDNVVVNVKGNDAFSIEFEHRDPKMAMLVADRLTTLFMEEVVGGREKQVGEAYEFIESQLTTARKDLEEKEAALREFKEAHMGQLPEQVQANLATLQRLQLEQQTVADSLRRASDALLLLESTPQAAALAGGSAAADPLTTMRAQLQVALTRYTEQHPDVKALRTRIEALEAQAAAGAEQPEAPPLDPAAAALQRRLREARLEVQAQRQRLADVERRIAEFQARVEAAPKREQEVLGLTRDYQKLSENYTQLLAKKLDVEMAARLEQRQKGQQFRIIDPAYLPVSPSFPDRVLFAIGGALIGLLAGIGLAVGVDALDPSLKEAEEASKALRLPLLAVIPYVGLKEQERLARLPDGVAWGPDHPEDAMPRRPPLPFRRASGRGKDAG
jgi:polysaccharide chain length determinant protein (PEP-CTERM system associated)